MTLIFSIECGKGATPITREVELPPRISKKLAKMYLREYLGMEFRDDGGMLDQALKSIGLK